MHFHTLLYCLTSGFMSSVPFGNIISSFIHFPSTFLGGMQWQQPEVSPDFSISLPQISTPPVGSPDISKPTVRYKLYSWSWVCPEVSVQWDVPDTVPVGADLGGITSTVFSQFRGAVTNIAKVLTLIYTAWIHNLILSVTTYSLWPLVRLEMEAGKQRALSKNLFHHQRPVQTL